MKVSKNDKIIRLAIAAIASGALLSSDAHGQSPAGGELDFLRMGMDLLGGLALFLFGMEQLSKGLKAAAGNRMKELLAKLTTNRFTAVATGAFVTAVVQSSSITTVLVVGFVTAGLMSLTQSIGVIMGANVGTTLTAQIIAFKVEAAALLIIAFGFGLLFMSKTDRNKQIGSMVMGLGMVFFGMSIMSEAMHPLRSYHPFMAIMAEMEKPVLGILVAAVFTSLVQSSSAATGVVIAMSGQGLITLTGGIALIFGANIGTCVTALLAAIGKPAEALRAAAVHVFFNVAGVLVWLAFIPELALWVSRISPAYPELAGSARLAAEVPRQIANAHTVFNLANTLLFIAFTTQIAVLSQKLIPERKIKEKVIIRPKFLDDALLTSPTLALDRVRMEIGHLGEITILMLKRIREAYLSGRHEELEEVAKLDDKADILHKLIMDYVNLLIKNPLGSRENELVLRFIRASEDLERVGDAIETDLVRIGHAAVEKKIVFPEGPRKILNELYDQVFAGLQNAVKSVTENNELAAQQVLAMKAGINHLVQKSLDLQTQSVAKGELHAVTLTRFEVELIDCLKRIYSLSKRIAKLTAPAVLTQESV
ncbi:MAG: Na/Pi cotransporter family protein [Gammaproteobacteria bacterium]